MAIHVSGGDPAAIFPASMDEVPAAVRPPLPIEQRDYLVDGRMLRWEGEQQEIRSPICLRGADGRPEPVVVGSHPRMDGATALLALDAAVRAWDNGRGRWPTLPVSERIAHVEQFVRLAKARRTEVVNLLMWEIAKTAEDAAKEFDRTIEYVVDTLEALKELDRTSARFSIVGGIAGQIRRAPLGVVLSMGPYNYPLNETLTTLIPALVMGNTVVMKPPRLGVLLFRPLLDAFREAFPPGVVNTVYGDGPTVVTPLMASGKVNVLAFIGSSRVSDVVRRHHPLPHRLRCVLGLDAKNPAIVLPDADLETTAKECLLGTLSFNGQRCTALKILFVHRNILGSFLERFCAAVDGLACGLPWDAGANVTPLPGADRVEYMTSVVADAVARGARVLNPGGGESSGTFFRPAVVGPIGPDARLWSEEQFGPVVPIVPFDDLEVPIRYVEESNYGQQVSLFGTDPARLAQLVDPLVNQVCRVNLNSQCQRGPDAFPFTGRKDSAEGTLSVSDALRVFSIRTLVAAKQNDLNRRVLTDILHERRSNFLSTDFLF
jgi:glyceraldehyde-3-phosphate dehydrogenase (NADP+)